MATVEKAEENGYAERFMRTIKEEEVDLSEYRDFKDALDQIRHFINDVYMTKRIHSFLRYLNRWNLNRLVDISVYGGIPLRILKKCPTLWVHYTYNVRYRY
jgi:hypothetical protein